MMWSRFRAARLEPDIRRIVEPLHPPSDLGESVAPIVSKARFHPLRPERHSSFDGIK